MKMLSSFIELKNVTKTYLIGKTTYNAVTDISLQISQNEFVALMGPSGSGKSTLLNLIGGLDRPSSGEIIVEGKSLTRLKNDKLADYRKKNIGIIFQNFNLLPHLTALENTNMALIISGQDDSEGQKMASESLKWIGLGDRLLNKPTELSGGEQQRVAIVRAIVKNPRIVLADEPTGNLDTKTGDQIVDLIKSLKEKGKTIVLVTHNEEIARKADRVIRVRDGVVVK